jgi:Uma2 family endonuclease
VTNDKCSDFTVGPSCFLLSKIIVCDLSKIDARGCLGAPDMIIEIISPKNPKRDLLDKFRTPDLAQSYLAVISKIIFKSVPGKMVTV